MAKLNPIFSVGPRTIVPITSLFPELEDDVPSITPDPVAAPIGIVVGRPILSQYDVTAQGSEPMPMVDLSILLGDHTVAAGVSTGSMPTDMPVSIPSGPDTPLSVAVAHDAPALLNAFVVTDTASIVAEPTFTSVRAQAFLTADVVPTVAQEACVAFHHDPMPIDAMAHFFVG